MSTGTASDPRRDVAKGVGSAFLAKCGSVIEIVIQPVYTWMFGLATYGLYSVFWSYVNVIEKITNLAMTNALQRLLPKQAEAVDKAAVIKGALILGILPGVLLAVILTFLTHLIAPLFNVAESDQQQLVTAISLFVWAIPLWAAVEVVTSALRACRAFGADIRLRFVWEQIIRVIMAVALWLAGFDTLALLLAHLASLSITAVLALRVLNQYCSLKMIWRAKPSAGMMREILISGLSILPANISGRLFTDMPVIIINLFFPGSSGANAAGLYTIARKLSSIPQLVRTVFYNVLAPIAASRENREPARIQSLYAFSVRLSLLIALPTAMTLVMLTDSVLRLYVPEAAAAWSIVVILTLARGIEAVGGSAVAVQQVISHRGLPLLNSAIGLLAAAVVMLIFVPRLETTGVAMGVATGQVLIVALSAWQLLRFEKLKMYDHGFLRIVAAVSVACLGIFLAGTVTASTPVYFHATAVILLYLSSVWLALRFALPANDHIALGKFARRLRLIR